METNETFEQAGNNQSLVLTFEAQSYLREAGKWAYFLGILGFIFCIIILIVAFFAGSVFTKMAELSPNSMVATFAGMGGFVTVFYILIDLIYFFFALYLYQFGSQIKKGITFTNETQVTSALGKLKSFFRYWAILTIIVLSLYALIIIGAIALGVGASMMNK